MTKKFCDNPECVHGLHQDLGAFSDQWHAFKEGREIQRFEWGGGHEDSFSLCADCSATAQDMIKENVLKGLTNKLSIGCQSGDNLPRALNISARDILQIDEGKKRHIVLFGHYNVPKQSILLTCPAEKWCKPAAVIECAHLNWRKANQVIEVEENSFFPPQAVDAFVDFRERHPGIVDADRITIIEFTTINLKED